QPAAGQQPGQLAQSSETAACPQCGHSYIRPAGEAGPCLSCHTQARLTAAGYTPDSPAITQIAEWNHAVLRRGDRQPDPAHQPDRGPPETGTENTAWPVEAEPPAQEREAGG